MAWDWIEEYLSASDHLRTPFSYRLWTGLSILSAVLERRCWTVTDVDRLYPNQYIILAGAPATGKGIALGFARATVSEIAAQKGGVFLGPDNPTKASFLQQFEKSSKISINGLGVPYYSAMYVMCREFGVLISKYERDFIADLTDIYDNPPMYTAPRKSVSGSTIEAPTLNLIAGATPDALGDTIPEIAWNQGFTSRFIFVYGAIPQMDRDPLKRRRDRDLTKLKKELKYFFEELHGEFVWEDDAHKAIYNWINVEKEAPVPTYGRLKHYVGRRNEHLMKLSMVSAVSAGHGLTVTESDFRRAQQWLFETEETMPDVFRAMGQKSDQQLMSDAHYHAYTLWSRLERDKRIPLKEVVLWKFFEDKTPHDKIDGLINAMHRTGRIRPGTVAGEWIPNTFDKIKDS